MRTVRRPVLPVNAFPPGGAHAGLPEGYTHRQVARRAAGQKEKQMLRIKDDEKVTPALAERVLASALVNHDTNSDLVVMTCSLAAGLRRSFTYGQARLVLKSEYGAEFDAEGWMKL